ncbi:MAG: 4Fe-4S dicluster domain-containing protein [Actinomycetota bacterium]
MAFDFRIDISRCIGCMACTIACVTANDLDPSGSRNWVKFLEDDKDVTRGNTSFAPYLCMHCDDAPCVTACPTGASFKAKDGRVLVDEDLCIGCGLCVPACPYEARYVDPVSNKLQKCTMCEGRTKNGQAPACFEVCPAGARSFYEVVEIDGEMVEIKVGDVNAIDEGHEEMKLVSLDVNPGPNLRFSGLPEDLALLQEKRPPQGGGSSTEMLWRNGAGKAVGTLGVASAVAMAGMIGLGKLRERKERVASEEAVGEEVTDHEEAQVPPDTGDPIEEGGADV